MCLKSTMAQLMQFRQNNYKLEFVYLARITVTLTTICICMAQLMQFRQNKLEFVYLARITVTLTTITTITPPPPPPVDELQSQHIVIRRLTKKWNTRLFKLTRFSQPKYSCRSLIRNKERYQNDPWLSITLSLPK